MKQVIISFILVIVFLNLQAVDKFTDGFLDKNKYGWIDKGNYSKTRVDKLARQKLLQIYDLKQQNILDNVIKSAVAPGWGQMSAGQYTKGQILMGAEIILFGSFIYLNDKYQSNYNSYKKANYITDINHFYDKANEHYATSRAILGLGIGIWLYNLYDAVITTSEYNQDVWNSLYKDYRRKKIVLSPIGLSLRF